MLLKGGRLHAQIVQFAQIALFAGMGLVPLLLSAAPAVRRARIPTDRE